MRYFFWHLWNRTRYYWPQAQSRRRAIATLRDGVESQGVDWDVYREWTGLRRRPWWIP